MRTAAAERENRLKTPFAILACPSANRPTFCGEAFSERTLPDASNYARVSLSGSRACCCALQNGGRSILWVIASVLRSAGCRPSTIASTILGARNASRITRRT